VVKVFTGTTAHDVSISSRNVSSVGGFLRFKTPQQEKSRSGGVKSGGRGGHCFFVLFIDLVGFRRGGFSRLGGSVVVRHLVESKADEWHVKWMSGAC
jgi:hypothetical protein